MGNTRTARHNVLVCSLVQLARQAGSRAVKDPPIILPVRDSQDNLTNLRPADLSILGDNNVTSCVDVTIISNLCPSNIGSSAKPGKAVEVSQAKKVAKHEKACMENNLDFVPFAVDVCGVHGSVAIDLLHRLATAYQARSMKPFSQCLTFCYRRISFAIQTAVANQLSLLIYGTRWVEIT